MAHQHFGCDHFKHRSAGRKVVKHFLTDLKTNAIKTKRSYLYARSFYAMRTNQPASQLAPRAAGTCNRSQVVENHPLTCSTHAHTRARQTCVSCPLSVPSVSCGIVDLIINTFAHIGEHVVAPWCSQLRQTWKWSQQGRPHSRGFCPEG